MKSPFAYVGGKSRLAGQIVGMIPEHRTYCEVCAGAAWVFFRRPEPSKVEVINDLDGDLVAFYRVVRHHPEEFLKQFKMLLISREWFEDWKRQQEAGGLTDIQRAARYYYLQRLCFGGKVRGRTFGVSPQSMPRLNLLRIEEEISAVHLRLSRVCVENLTWEDFLPRYDRSQTFFFIDPPYYRSPQYAHNFKDEDFQRLADALASIKGRFLLTVSDCQEMRNIFKEFSIKPVSLSYSVAEQGGKIGRELIVTNY